jgi:hypothetical protein
MHKPVEMIHVMQPTRCSCGEDLRPGERAGLGEGRKLLCLWCLADLQAGRPRPRRRRVATPWPSAAVPQRPASRSTHRHASPRRHRGSTGVTVAIALLLAGAALYIRPAIFGNSGSSTVVAGVPIPRTDVTSWGNLTPLTRGNPQDTGGIWPPVPPDARSQPLGTPQPKTSSSTHFAFMKAVPGLGGRPVTWDPCRPIHLVVNNAQAPAGSDQLLREAAGAVSSTTTLRFVIDGPTTEPPTANRTPLDKARYGNRWSPVLAAWTDPSVVPELQGAVTGIAGPVEAPYFTDAQQHWVSGIVDLDGPQFREMLQTADGWAHARAIVMHELGHLVGLAHVPVNTELMYPENIGQRTFGPGDREGLRQLGRASLARRPPS